MGISNQFHQHDKVYGLPSAGDLTDFSGIFQGYSNTCAIRSQEIILRNFGLHIPQETLIEEARAMGIYGPHGTQMSDVGKLLELHGVNVMQYQNASVFDLVSELAQGKNIIVAVDSNELWAKTEDQQLHEFVKDILHGEQANHALIVAGIDTTDPADIKVTLTDPGTGHVAKDYPLSRFLDAWHDGRNFMMVTEQPAPKEALGMVNFDYAAKGAPIGAQTFSEWMTEFSRFLSKELPVALHLSPSEMSVLKPGMLPGALPDKGLELPGIAGDIPLGDGADDIVGLDLDGNGTVDIVIDEDGQMITLDDDALPPDIVESAEAVDESDFGVDGIADISLDDISGIG